MLISILNTETGRTRLISPTSIEERSVVDPPALVIYEANGRRTTVVGPVRPEDEYQIDCENAIQNILNKLYCNEHVKIKGRILEVDGDV